MGNLIYKKIGYHDKLTLKIKVDHNKANHYTITTANNYQDYQENIHLFQKGGKSLPLSGYLDDRELCLRQEEAVGLAKWFYI